MAYTLKMVKIRTNNSAEGRATIDELWQDVGSGKLPLLFDSTHNFRPGISPVSRYSHYESDEKGDFDLSIIAVTADFFAELEKGVAEGRYQKYDECGDGVQACAQAAWAKVWSDQRTRVIARAFTKDFESTVPAEYTKDGKAHCYLYIAIK